MKYEIYDLDNKERLQVVERGRTYQDIFFFGEKYLLEIKYDDFFILDCEDLKQISTLRKNYCGHLKDWAIFQGENDIWFKICNYEFYKIINNNIEFIKRLEYGNTFLRSAKKYEI